LLRVQRRGHIFIGVEHGTDDVRVRSVGIRPVRCR
jgi:hypothetical protein